MNQTAYCGLHGVLEPFELTKNFTIHDSTWITTPHIVRCVELECGRLLNVVQPIWGPA